MLNLPPTPEAYHELQTAFDVFNARMGDVSKTGPA